MESTRSFVTDSPRLVVIEGNDKGKVIPLKDGNVVVGRSKGDVLVHDPRVSRSHITLHFDAEAGTLSFTDLKSLNGTFVNGEPKEAGDLKDGDKLQIGNTVFDCQIGDATSHPKLEIQKTTKEETHAKPTKKRARIPVEMLKRLPPVSRRTRNIIAGATVVVLFAIYVKASRGPSEENLERDIAYIRSLATQGKIDEALARADELKKRTHQNAKALLALSDVYASQHRVESAIEVLRKAHTLQPVNAVVHVKLAKIFFETGLKKEALGEMAHIDTEIQSGSKNKEFFVDTAQMYLERPELTDSQEKAFILARALQTELAPNATIGFKLEAQTLKAQGNPVEALKAVDAGLKIDTTDEWLLENRFFFKLNIQDVPGAAQAAEDWLHFHPQSSKALLVVAYLKVNDKKYLEALPYVQRVIQNLSKKSEEPHYAEALNLAGQIYWQQGQKAEAETHLKQACALGFQQSCLHDAVRSPSSN